MNAEIMQKIELALREVLHVNQEMQITSTSKLKDDLGLDSMSSLTFLMALEESIDGFVVDPETLEMSDLETVISMANYVMKQTGETSTSQNISYDTALESMDKFAQVAYA